MPQLLTTNHGQKASSRGWPSHLTPSPGSFSYSIASVSVVDPPIPELSTSTAQY